MNRYNIEKLKNYDSDSMSQLCSILLEESISPAVIYDVINDGESFVFSYVNKAMLSVEKISEDMVLGKTVEEAFPGVKEFGLIDILVKAWSSKSIESFPLNYYSDTRVSGYRFNTVYPLAAAQKLLVIYEKFNHIEKILNTIYGFIGIYDKDGTLLECNDAPLIAAGLKKEEVIGKPFWEAPWWSHSVKEQERIRLAIARAADDEAVRDQYTVSVKGGAIIQIDATFEPVYDDDGVLDKVIGFGVDITNRNVIEESLKARNHMINEASKIGMLDIWEFDIKKKKIVRSCPGSLLKIQDLMDFEKFTACLHEDDKQRIVNDVLRAIEGKTSGFQHMFRLYFKDGSLHFITTRAKVLNDDSGAPKTMVGASIDITSENEIGERYERMMSSAPDGLIVCNKDGFIKMANESICRISSIPIEKLIGKKIHTILPGLADSVDLYKIENDDSVNSIKNRLELVLVSESNESIRVVVQLSSFRANNDSYINITIMDNESFSVKYGELLESKADQLNIFRQQYKITEDKHSKLARELHDELGQTLAYIKIGLGQISEKLLEMDSDSNQYIAKIMNDIDQAALNIRHNIAELRPPLLDDLGLEAAIESHVREYMNRYGIDIHLDLSLDGLILNTEIKSTFFRVFQESLTNIAKHSKASLVVVVLRRSNKNYVELQITDNGRGFNQNAKIVGNYSGIGGMRQRLEAVGGVFNIISESGKGTAIKAIIPNI